MWRCYIIGAFLCLLLVSCTTKSESMPITSLRFTPLNFPYSNLGEFTLHEAANNEQLQLFLKVFDNTFLSGHIRDDISLQDLTNTFSLQLFSETKLTAIYRLSFDFEKDVAFLQNEHQLYEIDNTDFHQIIETGYFNVMFRKNHAPTAEFLLNNQDIKYSVSGTWNYETYQNNFLSYQINKEQYQNTSYTVTDNNFLLTYSFPEKQPDEIYETIRSSEGIVENRKLLTNQKLHIPSEEGNYTYELEAVWSDPTLPYKATLNYQFRLEVNYPPKVKLNTNVTNGTVIAISVENYDSNGKITVSSDLWEKEIQLTLINQKYHGLLPIPLHAKSGEYQVNIIGSNSSEILYHQETLKLSTTKVAPRFITKKQMDNYTAVQIRNEYYLGLYSTKHIASTEEKLWTGNFILPTAMSDIGLYGQQFKYKDFEYQSSQILYSSNEVYDIFATANGIIRMVDYTPEWGYCLFIDHGLGVFSIYSGISEILISPDSYVFSKQKIGNIHHSDTLPTSTFSYAIIVHGYPINPHLFFDRDPISLFK